MKGMVEMKKTFRKIIVSILTIALIASMSAIVPVFAEGTAEPAAMYIDDTYALWGGMSTSSTSATAPAIYDTEASSTGVDRAKMTETYWSYVGKSNTDAYYLMSTFDKTKDAVTGEYDQLVINLPEKEGYKLHSVGILVQGPYNTNSLGDLLNYSAGSDNASLENLNYSTTGVIGNLASSRRAFLQVVKIPDDAKKLKIKQTADYTSTYGNLSVVGFTFAYIPVGNPEVITVSGNYGQEAINLLSSGLFMENMDLWVLKEAESTNADKLGVYGLAATSDSSQGKVNINSLEGYKITSFVSKHSNQNNTQRNMKLYLGENASAYMAGTNTQVDFSVSNPEGASVLSVQRPRYDTDGMTNITITMKRDVAELGFAVSNAVAGAENVTATVDVSNIYASENDTKVLLVAGYEGTIMTDVDIIPVSKADASNSYTATLSKNVTKVRAFLWKDLATIVPVLEPTPEFSVN